MNLSFLTNIFQRKHKVTIYKHEIHTYRDWALMLLFTLVGIVALSVFHAVFFLKISADELVAGDAVSHVEARGVNRSQLKKVIDTLQARAALFSEHRVATSTLVDPSR